MHGGSLSLSQALLSSTDVKQPLLSITFIPQGPSSSLPNLKINLLLPTHPNGSLIINSAHIRITRDKKLSQAHFIAHTLDFAAGSCALAAGCGRCGTAADAARIPAPPSPPRRCGSSGTRCSFPSPQGCGTAVDAALVLVPPSPP